MFAPRPRTAATLPKPTMLARGFCRSSRSSSPTTATTDSRFVRTRRAATSAGVVVSSLAAVQPIGSSSASGSSELAHCLAQTFEADELAAQIERNAHDRHPVPDPQVGSSRLEVARIRRDQHEVVAGRGKRLRERAAEARRGADDHRRHSASLADSSERKPAAGSSARRRSRNSSYPG